MRVILESPFSGDIARNLAYLRAALRDSLLRGEAPFASHGLYTQPGVLDDSIAEDRGLGMAAARYWTAVADKVVVYCDLGISPGMVEGTDLARDLNIPVEYRRLAPQ